MHKDIAEKWVAALRSGKYEQGREHLSHEGKYCCLGVLCELAAQDSIVKVNYVDNSKQYDGCGFGGDELLPSSVCRWAGMKSRSGKISGEKNDLTQLNDYGFKGNYIEAPDPLSFDDIANIIEDYWKDL